MLSWSERVSLGLHGGVELSIATLVLTVLLELTSYRTVIALYRDNAALYKRAIFANVLNHFVLGVPVYLTATVLFCRDDDNDSDETTTSVLAPALIHVSAMLLIHGLLYYYAHKTMHHPRFYKHHKFHHSFNKYIPPSAANAVSVVEYLLAYVIPFCVGSVLVRPSELELRLSVYIVSACNLLIHTPTMTCLELPEWLVSALTHQQHHRQLTSYFAAPILNFDWFMERSDSKKSV